MLVCVVSSSSKEVPSSLGMQRTVNTSGLLEARVNIVLRELYRSRINSYLIAQKCLTLYWQIRNSFTSRISSSDLILNFLIRRQVKGIKSKVLDMESAIIAKDFPK